MKIINNMRRYFVFIIISITAACGVAFSADDRILWLMILISTSFDFIGGEVRNAKIESRMKKYKKAYKKITKQIEEKEL